VSVLVAQLLLRWRGGDLTDCFVSGDEAIGQQTQGEPNGVRWVKRGGPVMSLFVARGRRMTDAGRLARGRVAAMRKVLLGALLALLLVPASAPAATVYEGYSRVGSVTSSYGGRYNVYAGYSRVGYVSRSYGGRWNVYEGYSRVGYVTPSYGGRWNIYSGYSRSGYVSRSYGGRWNIYSGYSRAGYVQGGTGGPAAGAALLLIVG
jgi:hypothetical protein